MEGTSKVRLISPMLAAADMDETIAFYGELLGFKPVLRSQEYAVLERDGHTLHFMKATSDEVMRCVRGHTEIYVEVDEIGPLWEHVKASGERCRIRELFEQPYGMTEFHLEDPNGCLVFVGQPTSK